MADDDTARPAQGLSLLLVEDDRLGAAHARRIMERAGHSTRLAGNGGEALRLLASERFAAAFLDIELPDMDGLTLARRFRAATPGATQADIPLFALTGHDPDELRERAATAGFLDVLAKPLTPDALARALERVPAPRAATAQRFFGAADADLAREFTAIFLEESPRQLAALRAAARQGDLRALAHTAHSLKSTSAMVDAQAASEAAQRLERAAAQGDLAGCLARLANLEYELNVVQESLAALTSLPDSL